MCVNHAFVYSPFRKSNLLFFSLIEFWLRSGFPKKSIVTRQLVWSGFITPFLDVTIINRTCTFANFLTDEVRDGNSTDSTIHSFLCCFGRIPAKHSCYLLDYRWHKHLDCGYSCWFPICMRNIVLLSSPDLCIPSMVHRNDS